MGKLNFYAVQGLPESDDYWINNYIQQNYKNQGMPQFQQSMNIDIITNKAKAMFNDIESKVVCIRNMLLCINAFNKIDINRQQQIRYNNRNNNNYSQIVEMNEMIKATIKEIDEMGLNEDFFQILQFCGIKKLNQMKKNGTFDVLMDDDNVDLNEFDITKYNQLTGVNCILSEMKEK